MNERFLRAKHWQLFALTFGLPIVFQVVNIFFLFGSAGSAEENNATFVRYFFTALPIVSIISMSVFFGWFWAIGVGLQSKVPNSITMKLGRFKFFLIFPLIYIVSAFLFITNSIAGGTQLNSESLTVILPLHLFSMFCIFYCLNFTAKTYKTVELQREVTFSDFAGEFFIMWFFPIGIWIIQPKINKLME